jgi:hypothetical protein
MSEEAGRLFVCARCRTQVVLCSRCDRGNVYCGRACSQAVRGASMREAGRRYQASRAGRFAHAERARRYRARRKNVTHQGSAATHAADLLGPETTTTPPPECRTVASTEAPAQTTPAGTAIASAPRCSRCGAVRAHAVRQGWLRRGRSRVAGALTGVPAWSLSNDLC